MNHLLFVFRTIHYASEKESMEGMYLVLAIFITGLIIITYNYWHTPRFGSISKKTKRMIPKILSEQSLYYKSLNEEEKILFAKRVVKFLRDKKFDCSENFELNDDIKVTIAATAVQITFGYKHEYDYKSVNKVYILPKDFTSNSTHKLSKGETGHRGEFCYVALSWESFKDGIRDSNDGINVGLHEFAHALFINNIEGNTAYEFISKIKDWHNEVTNIANEQQTHDFFRKYAFVNQMEFFAVSIEYFFENPQGFIQHIPELYSLLTVMLSQDPLKPNNGIIRN